MAKEKNPVFLELVNQDGSNREVFFEDGSHFENLDDIYYTVEHQTRKQNLFGEGGLFDLAKEVVRAFEADNFVRPKKGIEEKVKDSWLEILEDAGVPEKTAKKGIDVYYDVFAFSKDKSKLKKVM